MNSVPIDKVLKQLEVKKKARKHELAMLEVERMPEESPEVRGREWEVEFIKRIMDRVLEPCMIEHVDIPIPSEFTEAMDDYNDIWKMVHKDGISYEAVISGRRMQIASIKLDKAVEVVSRIKAFLAAPADAKGKAGIDRENLWKSQSSWVDERFELVNPGEYRFDKNANRWVKKNAADNLRDWQKQTLVNEIASILESDPNRHGVIQWNSK